MDGALFQTIADGIDAEWQKLEWREDAFSAIAERVVKTHENELRSQLGDVKEIVRSLQTMPWPEQLSDNDYGFPSVAFGRTPRTRVELVFWMDDAVKVHGHRAPVSSTFSMESGSTRRIASTRRRTRATASCLAISRCATSSI